MDVKTDNVDSEYPAQALRYTTVKRWIILTCERRTERKTEQQKTYKLWRRRNMETPMRLSNELNGHQIPNGRPGTLKQHQICKEPPKMVGAVGNAYGSCCINSEDEWVGHVPRKNESWSPGLFTYLHHWLEWRVSKLTRGMMRSKEHGKRFEFASYTTTHYTSFQVFSGNMKFEWSRLVTWNVFRSNLIAGRGGNRQDIGLFQAIA